jgi:hypothetical protein
VGWTEAAMDALARIQEAIRASDGDAILARWEFGSEVIALREGKQLPRGVSAEICLRAGISNKELSNRTRVAETYDQAELRSQLRSSDLTWTDLVNGLPKTRPAPKRPPKQRVEPTQATFKEADRVETLLARPDVAAELMSREATTKAAQKAQALAERKERETARQQKEHDQERQAVNHALRQRLVQGDKDWQNFGEQAEIFADTVQRYLQLFDGLTVPDELRLSVLDKRIGNLQQVLMELRGRLFPDHAKPKKRVATVSVITTSSRPS